MLTKDAVSYFGSVSRIARLLGISTEAVYLWRDRVPPLRQLQLERIAGANRLPAEEWLKPRASDEWTDPAIRMRSKFHASRTMSIARAARQSESTET